MSFDSAYVTGHSFSGSIAGTIENELFFFLHERKNCRFVIGISHLEVKNNNVGIQGKNGFSSATEHSKGDGVLGDVEELV